MHSLRDINCPNKQENREYQNKNINDGAAEKCPTTTVCIVEKKRGFKPSDRHNPQKKQFLLDLSNKIWQKNQERTNNLSKRIDLDKIFTPATDAVEILPKHRKLYASSAFYSPVLHPTIEDQVELARRISRSLSDVTNEKSKGQSMYVNRKKRSAKWVHEGYNKDFQQHHPQPETQLAKPNIESFARKNESKKEETASSIRQKQLGMENYLQTSLNLTLEKTADDIAFEKSSDVIENQLHSLGLSQTPPPHPAQCKSYLSSNSFSSQQNSNNQTNSCCSLQSPKTTSFNDYRNGLAYKPRIPQGWKSPSTSLLKDLTLKSYSSPPLSSVSSPSSTNPHIIELPTTTTFDGNAFQTTWKPIRLSNFYAPYGNENVYVACSPFQWPNHNKPLSKYNSSPMMHDKLVKFENIVSSTPSTPYRTDEFERSKNASYIADINRISIPYTDF